MRKIELSHHIRVQVSINKLFTVLSLCYLLIMVFMICSTDR